MINAQMISQLLPLLQNNPNGMMQQNGFNVPQNQQNNGPKGMVEYLMNSGQIDQNTYNQAMSIARQMGYNI